MKESENLRSFGYESYENKTARLKVESTICPDCNLFLKYCGLINGKVRYSYRTIRIFGICSDCGHEVEF
jgi:RNase P subunit RPR2